MTTDPVATEAYGAGPLWKAATPPPTKASHTALPTTIRLRGYPNPFNPVAKLQFELPEADIINLRIYDILGKETAVLAQGHFQAGIHEATWNASSRCSGIYFARLATQRSAVVTRLILSR